MDIPTKPAEPCPKYVHAADFAEKPGPKPQHKTPYFTSASELFSADLDMEDILRKTLGSLDPGEVPPAVQKVMTTLHALLNHPEYYKALQSVWVGMSSDGDEVEAYLEITLPEVAETNAAQLSEWQKKVGAWEAAKAKAERINEGTRPLRAQWAKYHRYMQALKRNQERKATLEAELYVINSQLSDVPSEAVAEMEAYFALEPE
tara:strand:- start:8838 stop:9449 length:612 start_codon:yes stop_codon:yes gene_type:complete